MITELEPIWVGAMPTTFEAGKLYISRFFDTAIHLCVCGCGMHTVTPLGGDGWTLGTHTDGSMSLYPSIRNPCGAHYWIDHDRVKLAHIAAVQARLQTIIHELNIRAAHHDESKLWEPEKSGYDRLTLALKDWPMTPRRTVRRLPRRSRPLRITIRSIAIILSIFPMALLI